MSQEIYQSPINGLLRVWTPNGQAMLGHKRQLGDLLLTNKSETPIPSEPHARC